MNGGLELGTFIIQLCSEGESGYTQTFNPRVIFSWNGFNFICNNATYRTHQVVW